MKIKSMFSEMRRFGVKTTIYHIQSKLGLEGGRKRYLQQRYSQMDLQEIIEDVKKAFYNMMGQELHLDNPQSFCEKIQWLKLFDATPLKTKLTDKYLVCDYIRARAGERYLIPQFGVWDSFDEIDFNALPAQFVLKMNTGSGMNLVVKDKSHFDRAAAKKKFDTWKRVNYALSGTFEMQYRDIPNKIIVEKYIEQLDGNLYDYKFHCFEGKAKYLQLIGDRDLVHHTGKQAFYDRGFQRMTFTTGTYPAYETDPKRPDNFGEMIEVAEKLAAGFCYVRVDLYSIGERVYFGEMTFTPANGMYPNFTPPSTDDDWGKLITLPKPYKLQIPKN